MDRAELEHLIEQAVASRPSRIAEDDARQTAWVAALEAEQSGGDVGAAIREAWRAERRQELRGLTGDEWAVDKPATDRRRHTATIDAPAGSWLRPSDDTTGDSSVTVDADELDVFLSRLPERERLVLEAFRRGLSPRSIPLAVGLSSRAVLEVLRKYGLHKRSAPIARPPTRVLAGSRRLPLVVELPSGERLWTSTALRQLCGITSVQLTRVASRLAGLKFRRVGRLRAVTDLDVVALALFFRSPKSKLRRNTDRDTAYAAATVVAQASSAALIATRLRHVDVYRDDLVASMSAMCGRPVVLPRDPEPVPSRPVVVSRPSRPARRVTAPPAVSVPLGDGPLELLVRRVAAGENGYRCARELGVSFRAATAACRAAGWSMEGRPLQWRSDAA